MPRKRIAVITARADESEQKHILGGDLRLQIFFDVVKASLDYGPVVHFGPSFLFLAAAYGS